MPIIKNYITQDDGITTVVVEGVDIDNKTSLLLDNGLEVECEVKAIDPFLITDKQLSLIHISEPTRHFKRSRMPSSA